VKIMYEGARKSSCSVVIPTVIILVIDSSRCSLNDPHVVEARIRIFV